MRSDRLSPHTRHFSTGQQAGKNGPCLSLAGPPLFGGTKRVLTNSALIHCFEMCADDGLRPPSPLPRKWPVVISPLMAIYHMGAIVISRAGGGSAVAAAAYRSGERIEDERTGEAHDYARRSGIDGTEIIAPNGAPEWVRARTRLWNEVEAAEKRKDSQVAREVRVALPGELDPAAAAGPGAGLCAGGVHRARDGRRRGIPRRVGARTPTPISC